jgi:hypothetical protein
MPKDPHGQAHTGTYGLFDDPDELAQTTAREEAHEIHRLQGQIRRLERRDRRLDRKEEKAAKRVAAGKAPKSKSKISSLLGRVFGRGSTGSRNTVGFESTAYRDDDAEDKDDLRKKVERVKRPGYKIVRRPVTPEQVYHAEDVDAVDSPWLRECGMVKVKSEGAGGCHIVSKSDIEKSE